MRQSSKKEEIKKAFEKRLEVLRVELLQAHTHFHIWEQLWPTEEVVRVINQYKGFFVPARDAHLNTFVVKATNVVKPSEDASFEHLFIILDNAPYLAPELDVNSLRARLKKLEPILLSIEDARHAFAHTKIRVSKPKSSYTYGQAKKVLEELQTIFNEIHRSFTGGHVWSFRMIPHDDTYYVLDHLKRKRP